MAFGKSKSRFSCLECGYSQAKWFGRCPQCGAWNSAAEETMRATSKRDSALQSTKSSQEPIPLAEVVARTDTRVDTGFDELNRVLGGGIVPGAAILLGGEPGIGKSTLLLQLAGTIAAEAGRVLYISGEESPEQIRLRAERVQCLAPELLVLSETSVDAMIATVRETQPFLVIVDSIQTTSWSELTSAPGSVAQVRDCGSLLVRLAKETGIPVVIVGHVTKEGQIAGPRLLEHLVDVVLYFEGDRHQLYRILRGAKNRFGSTYEIGIFEMVEGGLKEVPNPAIAFLGSATSRPPGTVVTITMEGNRPLLIEMQALVAPFHGHGFPRRTVSGIEPNRLAMILAVLEKRLQIPLGNRDIFLNVTGGISVTEPAGDLAIATAILSSYLDTPIDSNTFVMGEVGLSGEIRPVRGAEQRIREAQQRGYSQGLIPDANARELQRSGVGIERIHQAKTITEVQAALFTHETQSG